MINFKKLIPYFLIERHLKNQNLWYSETIELDNGKHVSMLLYEIEPDVWIAINEKVSLQCKKKKLENQLKELNNELQKMD